MIDSLLACATCASNFVDNDGPNAAGWSILFMLGVILPLLGGIVFFLARMIRRGEAALEPEFRDDLPSASPTR